MAKNNGVPSQLTELLALVGVATTTDTNITLEGIQSLSDAELSQRLLPLGIRLATEATTETQAVEGMLLAEAGKRLAGDAEVDFAGNLFEPSQHSASKRAETDSVLASYEPGTTNLSFKRKAVELLTGEPLSEKTIASTVAAFRADLEANVALGTGKYSSLTAADIERQVEKAEQDLYLALEVGPDAAESVDFASLDPDAFGAVVNKTTGEVTPLYPNAESSKQLLEIVLGKKLTKETLDESTEAFREALVAAGLDPKQAVEDAAFVNSEIAAIL